MNTTQKQDLKISSIHQAADAYELKIENKGTINAPFSITGIKNNTEVHTHWYDSVSSDNVKFAKGDYDKIRIDAYESTIDINRNNNTIRTSGILKKWESVSFKFILGRDKAYTNTVFYTPIIGANMYNKTMVGAAFYNSLFYPKKWEYIIAPMYAFGTQDLAGSAEIQRHFLTTGFTKRITLGLRASRFASAYFVPTKYEKLEPSIRFDLRKKHMRTSADRYILARYVIIDENAVEKTLPDAFDAFGYADLEYVIKQNRVLNPYNAKLHYQYGTAATSFQKLSAEATQFINYEKPKKDLPCGYSVGFSCKNRELLTTAYCTVGPEIRASLITCSISRNLAVGRMIHLKTCLPSS
jgi:hypothetical protein